MRSLGVVTTSYPQHDADVAGRFVQTHLRARRQQESLHVVAMGSHDGTVVQDGVQVTRVASHGLFDRDGAPEVWERSCGSDRARVFIEALRATAALTNSVRNYAHTWDAVESHWLVPSALAVAWAAPSLFHRAYAHSADIACLENVPGGAWLARWLVERVNEVVCVSAALAERLQRLVGVPWPQTDLRVEAMPVDAGAFGSPPEPAAARENLVIGVGRLVPIKGFDLLVLAVGGLPVRTRPQVLLLGEGPEQRRLAALAERVGVNLQMPGVMPPEQVAKWLAKSAVCVVSSRTLASGRSEGAPLVLREALALKISVIATTQGGLAAPAATPGLYLVPANDVASLRAALSKVLRTRVGKSA